MAFIVRNLVSYSGHYRNHPIFMLMAQATRWWRFVNRDRDTSHPRKGNRAIARIIYRLIIGDDINVGFAAQPIQYIEYEIHRWEAAHPSSVLVFRDMIEESFVVALLNRAEVLLVSIPYLPHSLRFLPGYRTITYRAAVKFNPRTGYKLYVLVENMSVNTLNTR